MTRRIGFLTGLTLTLLSLVLIPKAIASAQSVVQSYSTNSPLQIGTIVQLTSSKSDAVVALKQTNADKMFGVVVSANESPVSLSSVSGANQAFVATSGDYSVLVTNQDGSIKAGDYITISSLDGFGMKAGSSDTTVVGKALGGFAGTSDSLGSTILQESNGQQKTIQLGRIQVNLDVASNPLKQQDTAVPGFLRGIAQGVSNKPVSVARVYISLVILLADAIIAGSLLYAGVRSSVTAIGRNPLSRKSIIRSLIQITLTSLIVFIIGLFAVYLLLRF